jgi:hypothetical protein
MNPRKKNESVDSYSANRKIKTDAFLDASVARGKNTTDPPARQRASARDATLDLPSSGARSVIVSAMQPAGQQLNRDAGSCSRRCDAPPLGCAKCHRLPGFAQVKMLVAT